MPLLGSGLIFLSSAGASPSENPLLISADLDGLKITDTEVYQAGELYGYINGGAEIYLEYGFESVTVQNLVYKQNEFQIEYYKMTDPLAALGIFSLNKHNCQNKLELSRLICRTPFQTMLTRGPYYITITNYQGGEEAGRLADQLSEKIMQKIPASAEDVHKIIPNPFFRSHIDRLKICRGPLSLQSCYPEWAGIFKEIKKCTVLYLDIGEDTLQADVARLLFDDPADVSRFLAGIGFSAELPPGNWKQRVQEGYLQAFFLRSPKELFFFKSKAKFPRIEEILGRITKD
ncbi:MAG: hypothetical protein Kow0042_12690 [Calditrichia bacterium]